MRMLTRLHLEREFKVGKYARFNPLSSSGSSKEAISQISEMLHRAKEAITA